MLASGLSCNLKHQVVSSDGSYKDCGAHRNLESERTVPTKLKETLQITINFILLYVELDVNWPVSFSKVEVGSEFFKIT